MKDEEIREYEQKIITALDNLDSQRRAFTVADIQALRDLAIERSILRWSCAGCGAEKVGLPIYFHGRKFTEAKAYCLKCHTTNPEPELLFDPRQRPPGFGEEW